MSLVFLSRLLHFEGCLWRIHHVSPFPHNNRHIPQDRRSLQAHLHFEANLERIRIHG